MHPAEIQFINIAQRYALVGMQAAQAFNAEQVKLQLELVLSQERLASTPGTAESLAALERLAALTRAHKEAFAKVVLASSSELSSALAEMPENIREEYRAQIVTAVNWQLNAQSEFYTNRERWIAAAQAICSLVESCRETASFGEAGVDFVHDADLDRFLSLMATIEETHQIEVALLNERLSRLAQSATVLGIRPS